MADEHYDAIVIGTSQGGRFLPVELAQAGKQVALVERGPLGGVCVNTGCTPTKTMVASARLAYQARRGAEYGVCTGPVSVDLRQCGSVNGPWWPAPGKTTPAAWHRTALT
jgi:pyruvate/2-oxoglutarate dehydrogenase complex dihydrolipoamide dehydrogenase (E3) component